MGKELNEPTQPGWLRSRERHVECGTSFRPNQIYFPPSHSSETALSTGYVGGARYD